MGKNTVQGERRERKFVLNCGNTRKRINGREEERQREIRQAYWDSEEDIEVEDDIKISS